MSGGDLTEKKMEVFLPHKRLSDDPLGGRSQQASDGSSPCLSEMVVGFFEDGCRSSPSLEDDSSDAVALGVAAVSMDGVGGILCMAPGDGNVEPYRELLLSHALEAAEMASDYGVVSLRRLVVLLRELQHDAAIFETKWGSSRGLTAGDYKFVDVVKGNKRYLIDVNFAAQFEIARPTVEYSELQKSLPRVFVGTAEEVKRIVRIMCDAAKRSLSRTELTVPPWRKNNYMQKKWLGPYRRTVKPIPDDTSVSGNSSGLSVECRWVGFNVTVNDPAFGCPRSIRAV